MAKGFAQDRQWNWKCFSMCLTVGFVGQFAFGYPSSIIGVTLAQPAFLEYMHLINAEGKINSHSNSLIGATSGVFQAGAFFGILVGSYVMDRWGRKAGVVYCAVLSILGDAGLAGARNISMFIVFRFFAGAGSWAFLALTPVYSAELAPPKLRGFFVGMNAMGITFGYAMASYMGLAFYYAHSPAAQWRGPLGIALIFPVLMLLVIFIVPESPRWLLMVGQEEKARDIVMKLHYVSNDPDQEYARSEFYQMQKQTEFDKTLNPTWKQMFMKPSYRKRAVIACAFAFIGQSTAVLVINNYGPTVYKALGYNTLDQLILQCGWITVAIPSNFLGACIMDRIGRKPLMLTGVIGCCVCLILEAAMVASFASPVPLSHPNEAGLRMGVAAFYLFLLFYGCGIDCAGVVFYSELFPNHLRAKGVAMAIATIALTDLVYLQATATAFANIGWKFFLVFIIISGLGAIWAFFVLPETKGVPLEEIAGIFGDMEEVMVFSEDIHVDHTTHELVVGTHGQAGVVRVATEAGKGGDVESGHVKEAKENSSGDHVEKQDATAVEKV